MVLIICKDVYCIASSTSLQQVSDERPKYSKHIYHTTYTESIQPPVSTFYLENYMILVVREKNQNQNLCAESIGCILISRNKPVLEVSVVN